MYDPFDGLGPSFQGDAVACDRIEAETSDPEVATQIRIADAVVLQAVRDLVAPDAANADRLDAARWVLRGSDIPWLRGGSAPTDAVVEARHAKLLSLAQQAQAAARTGSRTCGMSALTGNHGRRRQRQHSVAA